MQSRKLGFLVSVFSAAFALPTQAQAQAQDDLDRDCQEFRVWAGIMGKKESHYVPTQRACDP